MKYNCGHKGCDICGGRECAGQELKPGRNLKPYNDLIICDYCLMLALRYAIRAAETFGGTIIDVNKPCGKSARENMR